MRVMSEASTPKKRRYHHGDLRTALIAAAEALIARDGPRDFNLADASRMAGVTAAAPYRHFTDKEALLDAVRARGFERLTAAMRAATTERGAPGTVDDVVAIGRAYVRFAIAEPEVFRLMFGGLTEQRADSLSRVAGHDCFGTLIERIALLRAAQGLETEDLHSLALPLWSLVHGIAMLRIDGDFDVVAPEARPDELVDFATRNLIGGVASAARAPT